MSETQQLLLGMLIGFLVILSVSLAFLILTRRSTAREWKTYQARKKEHQRLFREEASEVVNTRLDPSNFTRAQVDELADLGRLYWLSSRDTLHSREEIREAVQSAVTAVQDRLERIEQRFADEATIDKIASINEAILATKIEQLQKSVELLESRIPTRWDVATIAFAVLSAVGGLAGLIFTVANFVLK